MIVGIILVSLELLAIWELTYLLLFVFLIPSSRKPTNSFSTNINNCFKQRQDIIIPEWDNRIKPNTTQIVLPEPHNSENQCCKKDSEKKQFNKSTPVSMVGTPLFKHCGENGETYYYKKNEKYTRLFFPHDALLWLFGIITKGKRRNNQMQIKPYLQAILIIVPYVLLSILGAVISSLFLSNPCK